MNKVMIIGAIGAGKSTLTNALLNKPLKATKTQALAYEEWIIDTPGEYLENPLYYKNIIATSLEATHIIFLQDATRKHSNFPPLFASGMSKLVIGVITKSDADDADNVQAAKWLTQVIGHAPIVTTSAMTGKGITHIKELVQCSSIEEMSHYVTSHTDDELFFT